VKREKHPIILQAEKELKEYFETKRTIFTVPLDFKGTDFQVKVWTALLKVPYGMTKYFDEFKSKKNSS
jgi:methylated-DNA-[protein]-cysteine S-methyltransferase